MKGSCPKQSSPFCHEREGKSKFLGISVVYVSIDIKVEQHRLKLYGSFLSKTVIGFRGADGKFSGFV